MAYIKAPWTDDQVAALARWQTYGFVHEFTCMAIDHPAGKNNVLYPTRDGWRCLHCDYTQDWAHNFMFEPQTNPLDISDTKRGER